MPLDVADEVAPGCPPRDATSSGLFHPSVQDDMRKGDVLCLAQHAVCPAIRFQVQPSVPHAAAGNLVMTTAADRNTSHSAAASIAASVTGSHLISLHFGHTFSLTSSSVGGHSPGTALNPRPRSASIQHPSVAGVVITTKHV